MNTGIKLYNNLVVFYVSYCVPCVIQCSLCHTVFPVLVTDVCGDIFTV